MESARIPRKCYASTLYGFDTNPGNPGYFSINEDGCITTMAKNGMELAPLFTALFRFEIEELDVVDVE